MAEFIANPRRAPRAPARCRARVVSPTGSFDAETEDVGSHGCQVVSPRHVRKGDRLELSISNGRVAEPLCVAGEVAWVSAQAPWRVGIAFVEEALPESKRWFERLIAAYPGLGCVRRIPEKIPLDATVYLGPPPRFLLDFTPEEARVLRAVGSGVRVDELRARLRFVWPAAQRALFSLLARQAVTLARGQAVHPEAWKRILAEVEASLAVESLGSGPATLVAPPPSVEPEPRTATPVPSAFPTRSAPPPRAGLAASTWGEPPRAPHPEIELPEEGPALEVAAPTPPPSAAPRVAPPRGAVRSADDAGWGAEPRTGRADFVGAGVGWRAKAPRVRTAEAQGIFDEARVEIAAGNVNGAIALLRRALALSPGDPEIADALGKLAFKDRAPGAS